MENEKMDIMEESRSLSFRDLIEKRAKDRPDKVFIYDAGKAYTYKELDRCADLLAADLSCAGAKKGSHVGIFCGNSANWIIGFFAIQKLSAMAILVNPGSTVPELAKFSTTGDITYLLYGETRVTDDDDAFIRGIRAEEDNRILHFFSIKKSIDLKKKAGSEEGSYASGYRPENDDPALMIFTSGSTGRAKGAILSAFNVLHAAYGSMDSQRLTRDDRICNILPFFHIFGIVSALFAGMLADATLYLPADMHTDSLIEEIHKNRCTVFHAVPTMMLMILGNASFSPEKLSSLRCTILSAAAATKEQIERFHEALPNDHFLSAYGLSEAAPVSTLPYGDTLENCIETVGVPMDHIKLEIRDTETEEVLERGKIGEIVVRGDNLMTAYYKIGIEDQALGGDGWLHTGDLGYLRDDGYLCLTGRLKELIIRGGENIYPNEIASAISKLPCIEDVKVVGVPSDFYGEEVCACIKLKEGAAFDEGDAKKSLEDSLAKFKIPSFFVIYDVFPLLGSGKVDMVSLRKDAIGRCGR